MNFDKPDLYVPRPVAVSKYNPHQGSAERKRRIKQIANGSLRGSYITLAARYVAAGLVDPTEQYIIKG